MNRIIIALFMGATQVNQARADYKLVGSWVKDHAQQEDHAYPGDTNWNLEVTFQAGGQFIWHSTRTEGTNTVDESATGAYSVSRGMITYLFDRPSSAALKRLPDWFAFWPSKLKGQQQVLGLEVDTLVLAFSSNKLWLHMKRKTVEQSSAGAVAPQK